MSSASWALQRAVYQTLTADPSLTVAIGSNRIYDDVPRDAAVPYVTFASTQTRDWSSGSEPGSEHIFTLHVWSREAGRRQVHEVMAILQEALHDADLTLDGHRLANLRHEFSEARRESDGETYRGLVRFRAVTEPLDP